MKIENHILSILQLYEYAMAIGKSLDYKESCDLFLRLVLKRKNLNAAWILEESEGTLNSTYAIPSGLQIKETVTSEIKTLLSDISYCNIIQDDSLISSISPIDSSKGFTAIFNLNEQGYLFLYSKKDNLSEQDLSQLQPVIKKFSVNLKACKMFNEQKQLLKDLEIQNHELSDYAHMVSHDLKSPLRSIDTLSSWINEDYKETLDSNGQANIQLIRDNVEKMDTLINGILEYSTIGKTQLEVYDVDLDRLLNELLKGLLIPSHIQISTSKLPVVKGDKYRLQQLFQNLISNAINYNDKPQGTIEIGYQDKGDDHQFFVKDNGMGIDEVYFDKIFKTFESLENNTNSTGIGLSIVKKILDLYQGKIWIESQVGQGTTFYFTLKK